MSRRLPFSFPTTQYDPLDWTNSYDPSEDLPSASDLVEGRWCVDHDGGRQTSKTGEPDLQRVIPRHRRPWVPRDVSLGTPALGVQVGSSPVNRVGWGGMGVIGERKYLVGNSRSVTSSV